jgi:hypothetical protein
MEKIEYTTIDKSSWPRGPWDDEPDKVQWPDAATGLPCLIVRSPFGALCGYVGVPPGHPLHGKRYDDDAVNVGVHGGLTFSGACSEGSEDHGVCHKPAPGEPDDVYWFGFDCAHCYDLMPNMATLYELNTGGAYRDRAYVEDQCRALAAQLATVSP